MSINIKIIGHTLTTKPSNNDECKLSTNNNMTIIKQ